MKGLIKIGIPALTLVVVMLVFLLPQSKTAPLSEQEAPIRIAVSTTPLSAPFYIADQRGFFREAGVNVEIIDIAGGGKCFKALQEGQVDLATASNSVIMFNSFKHDNFSVLSSFVESDNDIKLLTLEKNQITQVNDFKHRKVGVVKGSASEYFFHTWLTLGGANPDNVEYVPLSVSEMPEALHSEKVDAISVWEPFAFKTAKAKESNAHLIETKGLYNLSFNLVGMKNSSPEQDEQKKRVLTALNKAVHYISRHPEESQLILRHRLKLSKDFISWIWQDYLFKLSLSQSLLVSLEQQAYWAIESGLITTDASPNFSTVLDPSLLKSIDQRATSL